MIFLFLILAIYGYKFLTNGNNKNIENIGEIEGFILEIKNYEVEANVTINSNKNTNTYRLKQKKVDNYQVQEIASNDEEKGIIIENEGNKLTIKNTKLSLEKFFDNYDEIAKNSVGFDSFAKDYSDSDDKEITEDDNYYIVFVKIKNSKNMYVENKTLFINKKNNNIEKIEVRDVNNNKTIVIEYTKFQIL